MNCDYVKFIFNDVATYATWRITFTRKPGGYWAYTLDKNYLKRTYGNIKQVRPPIANTAKRLIGNYVASGE